MWQHDKATIPGEFRWGWAGTPLAICDVQGDARQEVICTHPVCFWVADGDTGELTTGRELASRKALPAWAAYGEPLVHDFNADGKLEVLLDSPYILAMLDLTGTPLWHGLPRVDFPVTRARWQLRRDDALQTRAHRLRRRRTLGSRLGRLRGRSAGARRAGRPPVVVARRAGSHLPAYHRHQH